jgi:diguanylate cyclase (GGDEF)-like protein
MDGVHASPMRGPRAARRGTGTPRRWTFAAIAAALGLGAPAGLLLLRSIERGSPPWRALAAELATDGPLYVYVTVSTVLAFAIFGAVVGGLYDSLRSTSLADPLTALPNRRHFELALDEALAAASREGGHLSLLVIDVDHLKGINDAGGHAAGDRALCAVAAALSAVCRRSDVPARISGDEFAVLAAGADPSEAVALAERIRARLAAMPGAPRISVGVATLARVGATDPRGLLSAADGALYEAKTTGRDRVVEAPPREAPSSG